MIKRKRNAAVIAAALMAATMLGGCDTNDNTPLPTDTVTETQAETSVTTATTVSEKPQETAVSDSTETVAETTVPESTAANETPETTVSESEAQEETSETTTVSIAVESETVSEESTEKDMDWSSSAIAFSAAGNPVYFPANGEKSPYTGRKTIDHPYSYYTLNDRHQKIYDELVTAMLDCESSIKFSYYDEVTFDDLFSIYQLIYNDEYRLFYISPTIEYTQDKTTGFVTQMRLLYNYDADVIADMKAEIEEEAEKILSQITPDMSDYEIVKLFHDSVIISCKYSGEAENPNTIYGCLVDKEALCQAYSQTFTYLCHRVGIKTLVVLGVANEPHMWNIVEMGGDYYHIDLTWDDPDRSRNPDSVRYDYFGLTDERIRELRQVDDYEYEVPAANGTKYQYYSYNDLVAADTEEAKAIITREALKAAENGSSTVQFMCADSEAFDEITSALFSNAQGNVITVLEAAKKQAARLFNTESVYHNSNENTLTVKIFLDYLD